MNNIVFWAFAQENALGNVHVHTNKSEKYIQKYAAC